MNWNSLFSTRRQGDPEHKISNPDQTRNAFTRDYDRIIFSSAFRRLQNKTQVFPLPGAVFVHNRLTHSLEVASVGRSLGKAAGEKISELYPQEDAVFHEFYRHELHAVIAAACLAHDIGNPPFGHSGEDAIRSFFSGLNADKKMILQSGMTGNQWKDFEYFEGNANAFRILTHPYNEEESSFRLTNATLAAIVKYPCSSEEGFNKQTGNIATRKSGFFDTEIVRYRQLTDALLIPSVPGFKNVFARHPFVYLAEAADDICYRIIDLEDAHRLKLISTQTFLDLFLPFFSNLEGYNSPDYIYSKLEKIKDENQKVQFVRAKWIGLMIQMLSDCFMQEEQSLLEGKLNRDLMSCLPEYYIGLLNEINTFSQEKIYQYRSVVEIEIAGFHVIGGLLEVFIEAVQNPKAPKSVKLLRLLPAQFPVKGYSIYEDVLSVVDFISGMTDLYAIDLYRKITGINIPEIR